MNELERKSEELLSGDWLNRDVGPVMDRAATIARRRRRTAAVVVAAFVLVFAIGTAARTRSVDDDALLTAAHLQVLDCATVINTGIIARSVYVTMKPTATQAEIDATRRSIEAIPGAHDVRIHDKRENHQQFRELFKDRPDLVAAVTEETMAVSFTATIDAAQTADVDRRVEELRHQAGVAAATRGDQSCRISEPEARELLDRFLRSQGRWQDGTAAIIFLDPNSLPAQRDEVAQRLVDNPTVRHVFSFTQQDAYDEFRCLFADSPELIDAVTPEILPWSYRIDVEDDGQQVAAVRDQVIGMPGVKHVVTPPSLEELITSGTIPPFLYEQLTTGSSNEQRSGETCEPAGQQIK